MSDTITDTYGRTITPTLSEDGSEIAYAVVGDGQNFTQTFPATTPQSVALACIGAAMPSALVQPPAPVVPQTVSRYQAMAVMSLTPSASNAGKTLLDDVTAAVTTAGGLVILAWQNSSEFDRNGRFVQEMSVTLGLSSAELDSLFIAAAQIVG